MLGVLFGSSFGSGGGGNAEADLRCDLDCDDGGAALSENEDDDDDDEGRAAVRPRLEKRGRLSLGHPVFCSELPALAAGSESEAVTAFFRHCGNHAVSLVAMADSSGGTCLVSLPSYDPQKQVPTHKKPCLVTLVNIEGKVTVQCSCSASRRRALERCWHVACTSISRVQLLRPPAVSPVLRLVMSWLFSQQRRGKAGCFLGECTCMFEFQKPRARQEIRSQQF